MPQVLLGVSYRQLRTRDLPGLGRRRFGRYPSPFDEQGLLVDDLRVSTRFWVGLDRAWIVQALRALSYLRPRFNERTWVALAERARPLVALANRFGGLAGGLRIEALNEAGDVLSAVGFLASREGLNIPALPSVWAARALLAAPEPGFCRLPSLITFDEAAMSLRGHGFEVSLYEQGQKTRMV